MGAVRLQVSELILRKLTGYMCTRVKTRQIPPFAPTFVVAGQRVG